MRLSLLACAVLCSTLATAGFSEGWTQIGYGRLINNDFIGDLRDRDQSGSVASSRIYSRSESAKVPSRAGELLELRLQFDIKSPDNLTTPAPGDRPFAGSIGLGLHTHFDRAGFQFATGAELVATGPQTGLDQMQTALHDLIRVAPPSAGVKAAQIKNAFHPGIVLEAGRAFMLSPNRQVRPFVEARYGVETLMRAGVDFTLGRIGQGDLMIRDGITGQRYRTILNRTQGYSLVLGADTAKVTQSAYLPSAMGYALTDKRDRARTGILWQGKKTHGFFGVTYLGKEYRSQSSPQLVGSIRLAVEF